MRAIDHPHFRSDPEALRWARRSSWARWLTKFSLLTQWGLAILAWAVFGVAGATTIGIFDSSDRSHIDELAFFALGVLPGACMVTIVAIRNSWIGLTDPARYRRDRDRAQHGWSAKMLGSLDNPPGGRS